MTKLHRLVNNFGTELGWSFWCPGCEQYHAFYTVEHDGHRWLFNNDLENPTFTPSLVVNYPDGKRCHLFLCKGMILYLNDCSHHLVGKVVELEDEPE